MPSSRSIRSRIVGDSVFNTLSRPVHDVHRTSSAATFRRRRSFCAMGVSPSVLARISKAIAAAYG